ncbi:hypothetical protein DESPIG_02592 [Desulfovibrio piger ATCC 29098]|uniref:Uncharacterized protein n=1 Tax=Desulfovibrio piger ATCC 29098 TaxID=411464 RepID=B6WWX0_9BACT|nr:hypothetical protein DESPIG_02592 [Desulfovibrio piger ATCC 29098]
MPRCGGCSVRKPDFRHRHVTLPEATPIPRGRSRKYVLNKKALAASRKG